MESKRIETFDDWRDLFHVWQKDIDYDTKLFSPVLHGYEFGEKFAPAIPAEIEFGEFADGVPELYVPDLKFRRGIGEYKDKRFSVKGELLDETNYAHHLGEVLPSQSDRLQIQKITQAAGWIAAH